MFARKVCIFFFKAYGIYNIHLQVFIVSQWLDFFTCSSSDDNVRWGHLMLALNEHPFFM